MLNSQTLYRCLTVFLLSLLLSTSTMGTSTASPSVATHVQATPTGDSTVTSQPSACVAVEGSGPTDVPIELAWRGTATRARLIINAAENEAPHMLFVNGQPIGALPVAMEGYGCRGEAFYLDVPVSALVSGTNIVRLTSDGQTGDRWIASSLRLDVTGDIQPVEDGVRAAASTATLETINFTNTYDGTSQKARMQVPDSYDGSPTPVVIMLHGRSGNMFAFDDPVQNPEGYGLEYHLDVNARGWFFASPEMHGHWPEHDDNGKFHHASLESQSDVLGTLQYLLDNYNIDPDRIYLYGTSLGGQAALLMAAKYPDIFAAVYANKPPTDWPLWYAQSENLGRQGTQIDRMEEECYLTLNGVNTPQTPAPEEGNPFCYTRRSPLPYASNLLHTPVYLTHGDNDQLVPIVHSEQLRDAVNALAPDHDVILERAGLDCVNYNHCFEPDGAAILDFLEDFTLNNTPDAIDIVTDQSNAYYWLNVQQSGGEHWSEIDVTLDQASQSVTVAVSDTQSLALGLNLGAGNITDIVPQPGMGLPATTYLVRPQNQLLDYSQGYLNVAPPATGQASLTISAVKVEVTANPATRTQGQPLNATISIAVRDGLGNAVPDGTSVVLTTSAGSFASGSSYTGTTSGGLLSTTLALGAQAPAAQINAAVQQATGSTTIDVVEEQPTFTPTPVPPTPTSTIAPTLTPTPPSTGTPNASATATSTPVDTQIPTVAPTSTPTPSTTQPPGPTATPTVPPVKTENPPVAGCRMTINDGNVFVGRRDVRLGFEVSNADEMKVSNDGGLADAAWQPYQPSIDWLLSDAGNRIATLSVYAQFRGSDGNLLCASPPPVNDDIIYDPLPPIVTVVQRQTSAVSSAGDEPAQFDVVVFINASDQSGGSGVAEMQISTDATFAGAVWQPYVPSAMLTISNEQPVYVRVRDGVGNLSNVAQAIEFNGSPIFLPFISG